MLKQIRYFQSVVKNNSFSEAAAENYISQSAISQQIQALERDLGFPLLERKNRKFTLTPAGEYFYQKSLILTADYDQICMNASRIASGDETTLRVGYLCSFPGTEFQQALSQFSGKHPEVTITITSGNHEELYDMLRTEKTDVILNDQRRAFSEEYINRVLTTCQTFAEVSAASPLAQREHLTLHELRNLPCILIASPTQQEIEQDYYRTVIGVEGPFLSAKSLEEARMMAAAGKGFLLTEHPAPADDPQHASDQQHSGTPQHAEPSKQTDSPSHPNDRQQAEAPALANASAPQTLCSPGITAVPLLRAGEPIWRNYCAFWKKDNSGYYVEEFADLLHAQFQS